MWPPESLPGYDTWKLREPEYLQYPEEEESVETGECEDDEDYQERAINEREERDGTR